MANHSTLSKLNKEVLSIRALTTSYYSIKYRNSVVRVGNFNTNLPVSD